MMDIIQLQEFLQHHIRTAQERNEGITHVKYRIQAALNRLCENGELEVFDVNARTQDECGGEKTYFVELDAQLRFPIRKVRMVAQWPPKTVHDTLTVLELGKKVKEYIGQGYGDYMVCHPGVAGDIFVTKTYIDDVDNPDFPVLVITDRDEKGFAKRQRFREEALHLPTIREWKDLNNALERSEQEHKKAEEAADHLEAQLDLMDEFNIDIAKLAGVDGAEGPDETREAVRQKMRRLEQLEKCICIEPHQLAKVRINQNADFTSGSAYCWADVDLFLTEEQGMAMVEVMRQSADKRMSMEKLKPEPPAPVDRQRLNVGAKSIHTWESFQGEGSDRVKVTLVVDEKTFKYGMLPALEDNREVKTIDREAMDEEFDKIRKEVAFSKALMVMRAALIDEGGVAALIDGLLMQPLIGVIGQETYDGLVAITGDILSETTVKMPDQGSFASHDYVHLKPTRGSSWKGIYYCGGSHSESGKPPSTFSPRKTTCPQCLVRYRKLRDGGE